MSHHAPHWKHALVRALEGLLLGLVTALLLVGASYTIWPGLKADGEDAGLRVLVALDGWWRQTQGTPFVRGTRENAAALTLLDLDSGTAEGGYCTAREWLASQPADARCDPLERIDRGLLAATVERLTAFGTWLIVLDVDLAEPSGAPDPGLAAALASAEHAGVAVLYPLPISTWQARAGQVDIVLAQDVYRRADTPVRAGAALPQPGDPLRRYAHCVRAGETWVPTLPWLAAQTLQGRTARCDVGNALAAPRIVYSLPTLDVDRDDPRLREDAAAYARWRAYRADWDRCLAARLADTDADCGKADAYAGRVVVVGATNPARRDRHYTPLGDLTGAEVVVNATRSFLLYPDYHDKHFAKALLAKVWVVVTCALAVWLPYFLIAARCTPCRSLLFSLAGLAVFAALWHAWPLTVACAALAGLAFAAQRMAALRTRCEHGAHAVLLRHASAALLFLVALALAVALALRLSFDPNSATPSLDILIPVLAVGIEVYVEKMSALLHGFKRLLERALGLQSGHA